MTDLKSGYELAVIIVNYRTASMTIDCVKSLLPDLSDLFAQVVIVDNYSNDGSVEVLQSWIDTEHIQNKVRLIESTVNTGFSGGNNTGINSINAKYYLLLNSDTIIRPGAISKLLKAADEHPEAGLISPRLEWLDGEPQESCFKFHSPISELIASAGTGPITKLFNYFNVPQPVSQKSGFYDWTSFACVLIRREVFDELNFMDDGYFMYYEDVAFSRQAGKAGWKVLNFPDAHVVHLRGGSSPVKSRAKLRKRLPRYFYESRTRYFYQFYGRLGLLLANILWSAGFLISMIRSFIQQSYITPALAGQWRDIWTNFWCPLKPYIHPDNYDKT